MPRRTHFAAVERLSPDALLIVHRGLRENWTYQRIAHELSSTGEQIARSSLARYAAKWKQQSLSVQQLQEQSKAFIAEIRAGGLEAEDLAMALITQALYDTRAQLQDADPVQLSREERERQKLELKRQEIELRKQEIALDRARFEELKARMARIKEEVSSGQEQVAQGKPFDGAEVYRKISRIIGLNHPLQPRIEPEE